MFKWASSQAHAAHKQRAWCRFGAWARARGVRVGDKLGVEVLAGGDPCRLRFHVRPAWHVLCWKQCAAALLCLKQCAAAIQVLFCTESFCI